MAANEFNKYFGITVKYIITACLSAFYGGGYSIYNYVLSIKPHEKYAHGIYVTVVGPWFDDKDRIFMYFDVDLIDWCVSNLAFSWESGQNRSLNKYDVELVTNLTNLFDRLIMDLNCGCEENVEENKKLEDEIKKKEESEE